MALNNHSKSTMLIEDIGMASTFKKVPKVVLNSTRPEKIKRLHEKQLGILDVFDLHIGDERSWLTASQIRVLHYLFARFATDSRIDMTEVPYELKLKAQTVNRIVQTFSGNETFNKKVEWFASERNPTDNRKILLLLTEAGQRVMDDLTLAMQVEVYGGLNPNVELYKKAEEAAKAKLQEQGLTVHSSMNAEAGDFVVEGADGQVGNVEIKADDVTTGAPTVDPTPILELGKDTTAIIEELEKRRHAKQKYEAWRSTADGAEYFARREGKVPIGEPILTRNGEKIVPPVPMEMLIKSTDESTAFARQMVRALDEQLTTEAKEKLISHVIESLPLREWNVIKDFLRQHNDNKMRTRKMLAEEQERIMANAATIKSPSERQDYIAQEYASRRNAEIEAAAQVNSEQQEQLREQIAGELRVTLRDEVREEVRKELLQQLLKGE